MWFGWFLESSFGSVEGVSVSQWFLSWISFCACFDGLVGLVPFWLGELDKL